MPLYNLVSTWHIPASADKVYVALADAEQYPKWWSCFRSCQNLTGTTGVGAKYAQMLRGWLPYTLRYTITITREKPPLEKSYDSSGDLNGDGRFVVTDQGAQTHVIFYWNVRTSGFWMNLLAPLLSWLFTWNHNWTMTQGEKGLTRWLTNPSAATPSEP